MVNSRRTLDGITGAVSCSVFIITLDLGKYPRERLIERRTSLAHPESDAKAEHAGNQHPAWNNLVGNCRATSEQRHIIDDEVKDRAQREEAQDWCNCALPQVRVPRVLLEKADDSEARETLDRDNANGRRGGRQRNNHIHRVELKEAASQKRHATIDRLNDTS